MLYTTCLKCNAAISNNNIAKHDKFCDGSGKRKPGVLGMRGKWNKGLTKETDPRLKNYGRKTSLALTGRPGVKKTEEQKAHLSACAKARGFGGTTQSRWVEYNGAKLGSSYEVTLAKDLDLHNVRWERPHRFQYVDPFGKKRTYTPDFYLPDYDVFLDPKNDFLLNNANPALGFSDTEKIRLVEQQNSIRVIILSKTQLSFTAVKAQMPL